MNQQIKQKWVKALLSENYKQGRGSLRTRKGYCCLGVLAESCGGTTPGDEPYLWSADMDKFDMDFEEMDELADMNDRGVPFDMIAGLIDQAL